MWQWPVSVHWQLLSKCFASLQINLPIVRVWQGQLDAGSYVPSDYPMEQDSQYLKHLLTMSMERRKRKELLYCMSFKINFFTDEYQVGRCSCTALSFTVINILIPLKVWTMIDKNFLNQKVLCLSSENFVLDVILTTKSKLIPGLRVSSSLNKNENLATFVTCE